MEESQVCQAKVGGASLLNGRPRGVAEKPEALAPPVSPSARSGMNWPPREARPIPCVSAAAHLPGKFSSVCGCSVTRRQIRPTPSQVLRGRGSGQEPPSPGECNQPGSDRDSWGQQGLSVLLAPGTSFGDVGMWGYLSPLQRTRTLLGAGCGHVILCGQKAGHGLASKAAGHCGLRLGERQCRVFTGSGSPRPRSGSRDLGRRPPPPFVAWQNLAGP